MYVLSERRMFVRFWQLLACRLQDCEGGLRDVGPNTGGEPENLLHQEYGKSDARLRSGCAHARGDDERAVRPVVMRLVAKDEMPDGWN